MRAVQVGSSKTGPVLLPVEIPQPQPGPDELLIRVRAAGVTPTEIRWYPTTHKKDGTMRTGAIPGHEFSGVIAATGKDVSDFRSGQEVYGMNDWFADGATAEFCLTQSQSIAPKPATLTHEAAAAVPIGALTAWQGLLDRARLQPGERVLVHGGAGAVGLFAVQLAHLHGAHVIATGSSRDAEFVTGLGAEKMIDYRSSRFEDEVQDIDVVFDGVGGETLARSWSVLKPGGRMVTIAAGGENVTEQRVKDAFFIVEPNRQQLMEIARLLDAGTLKCFVKASAPIEEAEAAYRGEIRYNHGYGKTVIILPA
ncbi:MAG TPA: NADP-dependent oxidoreductase [Acidobacteriaceae bacterium]|nr:NADP-dependent oxidoreductase [Acidobacteriaceae bacterium]